MKYISVCSGIEAATMAWSPMGWKAQFFSEIEKFPSAVLKQRHQGVPNLGDMTKFKDWSNYDADVLVGGTPCQSFSVAGLRKGLDDPRGNLMLTYLSIANRYRPQWLVWENVPGVLSSNGGKDFGTFLWALGELGYGFAYRVLDAQYFGVPQRRRRVFVVGCLGDWRRAAAVLFERQTMDFNFEPKRNQQDEIYAFVPSAFTRGFGERPNNSGVIGTFQKSGTETNQAVCFEDGTCRYLTPLEWERAQGFPDDYTKIIFNDREASVKERRGALGNSMAVPVMRWIGERIEMVRSIEKAA